MNAPIFARHRPGSLRRVAGWVGLAVTIGVVGFLWWDPGKQRTVAGSPEAVGAVGLTRTAIFAGGCFWCVESAFDDLPGVLRAESGYTGGPEQNPTYKAVSAGATGHLEAVRVLYNPGVVSYARLLETFWRRIDPTDAGGQFADRGPHYRSAIYTTTPAQRRLALASKQWVARTGLFHRPIATPILPAERFWRAEEYHQDYHRKHPRKYKRYYRGSGRAAFVKRTWGSYRGRFRPAPDPGS